MANRNSFTSSRKQRQHRYFSEDFKKKKVQEIERGFSTVSEVSKAYEVSCTAVYKWLHKYGVCYKSETKQIVELKSDTKKIEALKERIRELERALGQKQFELEFKDKMIEIAEETYQVDIKKKLSSKLSSGSGKTGMPPGQA